MLPPINMVTKDHLKEILREYIHAHQQERQQEKVDFFAIKLVGGGKNLSLLHDNQKERCPSASGFTQKQKWKVDQ